MLCPICGTELLQGSRFCRQCGGPVVVPMGERETQPRYETPAVPRKRLLSWWSAKIALSPTARKVIIGGILLALVTGAGIGAWMRIAGGVPTSNGSEAPTSVASQQISANLGGTVSAGDEVSVRIPPGALASDAKVTIARSSEEESDRGELEGAKSVGPAFSIDLQGEDLLGTVTLEMAFDPSLVPPDTPPEAIFLAFYNEEKGEWVPVYGTVDTERHVVLVETDHLSWWNPFSWALSQFPRKISQRLESVLELAGLPVAQIPTCGSIPRYMTVEFNDVLLACIESTEAEEQAILRVANNRAYAVLLHVPPSVQLRWASHGSLADAAAALFEEKLGQGAVYIAAAGEAEFLLRFENAGDISLRSAPSDLTLALDLLLTIFSMVGADPDDVVDGVECLFEAMVAETPELRTVGNLVDVAKECAGIALTGKAGIVWAAIRTLVTVGAGTGELLVDRTLGGGEGRVTVTYRPQAASPTPTPTPTPTPKRPSPVSPSTTTVGIYVNPEDRSEYLELKEDGTFFYTAHVLLGGFLEGEWEVEDKELVLTYHYFGFPGSARGRIDGNTIYSVIDEDGEVWADGWTKEETTKKGGYLSLTVGARYTIEVLDHYLIDPGTEPRLYIEYRNITAEPIRVRIAILWEDEHGLYVKDGGQENTRGPIAPGQTERLVYRPKAGLPPETVLNCFLTIHAAAWDGPWLPHIPVGPEIEPED